VTCASTPNLVTHSVSIAIGIGLLFHVAHCCRAWAPTISAGAESADIQDQGVEPGAILDALNDVGDVVRITQRVSPNFTAHLYLTADYPSGNEFRGEFLIRASAQCFNIDDMGSWFYYSAGDPSTVTEGCRRS